MKKYFSITKSAQLKSLSIPTIRYYIENILSRVAFDLIEKIYGKSGYKKSDIEEKVKQWIK